MVGLNGNWRLPHPTKGECDSCRIFGPGVWMDCEDLCAIGCRAWDPAIYAERAFSSRTYGGGLKSR